MTARVARRYLEGMTTDRNNKALIDAEADIQRAYSTFDDLRDAVAAGRLEPGRGTLPDEVDRAVYQALVAIENVAHCFDVEPY